MAEGGGTTQVEQVEEIELMSLEEGRVGHDLEELSVEHEGSPLHKAINNNELSKVRDIVGEIVNTLRLRFLLDERDKKNRTPLHSAVYSQSKEKSYAEPKITTGPLLSTLPHRTKGKNSCSLYC